ncbi:MAG: hypothetical protein JWO22_2867 [Frankiales bacterium]|nr:hypothetical protein [Frankiales bacterium]
MTSDEITREDRLVLFAWKGYEDATSTHVQTFIRDFTFEEHETLSASMARITRYGERHPYWQLVE